MGNLESRTLVGAGPPGSRIVEAETLLNEAVGNELPPDLARAVFTIRASNIGTVVGNGDMGHRPNILGNDALLVVTAGRGGKLGVRHTEQTQAK